MPINTSPGTSLGSPKLEYMAGILPRDTEKIKPCYIAGMRVLLIGGGVVVGAALASAYFLFLNPQKETSVLSQKTTCEKYVAQYQAEYNASHEDGSVIATVTGFYSPSKKTCIVEENISPVDARFRIFQYFDALTHEKLDYFLDSGTADRNGMSERDFEDLINRRNEYNQRLEALKK